MRRHSNQNLKRRLLLLFFLCTTGFAVLYVANDYIATPVQSQTIDDLENELNLTQAQIDERNRILEATRSQISRISSSSRSVSQKIADLEAVIGELEADISTTQAELTEKEEDLKVKQDDLAVKVTKAKEITTQMYKGSRSSILELILSQTKSNDLMRALAYRKYAFKAHSEQMALLGDEIEALEGEKEALEGEKANLDAQNEALAESKIALETERANLQSQLSAQNRYSRQISSEISILNNRVSQLQNEILIARSGAFVPSLGSTPIGPDYPGSAAGFRELAPSGSYATFAFGAYTHRNGMSQWGAKARDDSGHSYNQILSHYYPSGGIRTGTININGTIENISPTISVQGHGVLNLESEYLLGIREINGAWNTTSDMNILKAQVIAARTYALRYTNNGRGTICTTEACQVYSSVHYTGAWAQAVAETAGMILTDGNGTAVLTQYAAVHGGWVNNVGWDTTDGSGAGDWLSRSYEGMTGVSWLYKAWYRAGYSSESSSCGRYPWMTQEEMADIINTWLVVNNIDVVGQVDQSRILPVTINECNFGSGGNPYSMAEMRALLGNPVTSISGLPGMVFNGSGFTSNVVFHTNRGVVNIPGSQFKTVFNTRAPGYIAIPQNGFYHFNVERKL